MRKEHHHDPQTSLDAGYEVSDMNASILIKFAIGLMITIIASVAIIYGVIQTVDRRGPLNTAPVSPLTMEMRSAPVGPALQTDPIGERKRVIEAANRHLSTYAVVDENPDATRARIPVDLAINLVAEGAVPYRQKPFTARLDTAPAATPAAPATAPTPAPAAPATTAPGAGTSAPFEISDSPDSAEAQGGTPASGDAATATPQEAPESPAAGTDTPLGAGEAPEAGGAS